MPNKTKETTVLKEEEKKEIKTVKNTKPKSKSTNNSTSKVNSSKTSVTNSTKSSKTKSTSSKNSSSKTAKNLTTKATPTKKKPIVPVEYYDLPYRYNQTIVKILSQTPKSLFVYWDVSDKDMENFRKLYGDNFLHDTKPVLIVHNDTLNYSFEVEINDFANSWYLHINDTKCDYNVELGRRPINKSNDKLTNTNYIYIAKSNEIETPNNRILFNNSQQSVYFRDIKTNITSQKSISLIKNMGKVYNIHEFYKENYSDKHANILSNPSS